jgi:hypothetical protein
MYAKIRLTEGIQRAVPLSGGWRNQWAAGEEFYVRQGSPDGGMVALFSVDAGIGIPPGCVEVLEEFGLFSEAKQAYEAAKVRQEVE